MSGRLCWLRFMDIEVPGVLEEGSRGDAEGYEGVEQVLPEGCLFAGVVRRTGRLLWVEPAKVTWDLVVLCECSLSLKEWVQVHEAVGEVIDVRGIWLDDDGLELAAPGEEGPILESWREWMLGLQGVELTSSVLGSFEALRTRITVEAKVVEQGSDGMLE